MEGNWEFTEFGSSLTSRPCGSNKKQGSEQESSAGRTRLQCSPHSSIRRKIYNGGGLMAKPLEIAVNGKRHTVNYPPDTPLLYVLHHELGPTGAKHGLGEGERGAGTAMIR